MRLKNRVEGGWAITSRDRLIVSGPQESCLKEGGWAINKCSTKFTHDCRYKVNSNSVYYDTVSYCLLPLLSDKTCYHKNESVDKIERATSVLNLQSLRQIQRNQNMTCNMKLTGTFEERRKITGNPNEYYLLYSLSSLINNRLG